MTLPPFALSAAAVGAALLLAGCGGDQGARAGESAATAPAAGSTRKAAPATRPRREGLPVGFGTRNVTARTRITVAERAEGFMGRTKIDDGEALLFVYRDAGPRGFWMKNCLVPIDILYLADDGTVVGAATMPPPLPEAPDDDLPRFASPSPVRLVLETRGGLKDLAGVKVGSKIRLPPDVSALFLEADP
jgi:uncharacterized protein